MSNQNDCKACDVRNETLADQLAKYVIQMNDEGIEDIQDVIMFERGFFSAASTFGVKVPDMQIIKDKAQGILRTKVLLEEGEVSS